MLEGITQLLARIGVPGSFATRRTSVVDDLRLTVKGVGPIPLPVSSAVARRLCGVARPARYGLRDQTLLDERVRDGWEIRKSRIKIDAHRWQQTLGPQLEKIRRDLGVPDGCTLQAQLHNLLVYGPGQFFAPHQDSEKADGMIGTLVVTLPSAFKGGAFVVEHHDQKVHYRGSGDRLTFVAFYADCHHEVRPVTDGYRVVLTYNLLVEGATTAIRPPGGSPPEELIQLVREYFKTTRAVQWPHSTAGGSPDRLVYLLDHQYTQKGLGWQRLKNGDAVRAAALREVAERLDCEIVLALADVQESWTCMSEGFEDGFGYTRRWGYGYGGYDDDDDDDDDASGKGTAHDEDYTLLDLYESTIEIRDCIDASDRRAKSFSDVVASDEVCYTKPSIELEPFASEHQPYTGNAGSTVDRWYHRAAVVLWPRARTFAIRAKASPEWGIREVSKLLAAGKLDEARAKATQLRPFWKTAVRYDPGPGFIDQTLRVARGLDAPDLAGALLEPFALEQLTPQAARHCTALLERYGLSWCGAVFERWAATPRDHERRAWLAALPGFCGRLCTGGSVDQLELARKLVSSQWVWLKNEVKHQRDHLPSRHAVAKLVGLSKSLHGLLESSAIAQAHDVQRKIIELLTSEHDYPLPCSMALLRAAHARRPPLALATLGLDALHQHCTHALTVLLAEPPRAKDDWSIATPIRCKCGDCKKLARFLVAVNETQLEWPLTTEHRAHIHAIVERHELPVTHQTRRAGRPYTLVLTKTRMLFTREASDRKTWTSDLAWLRKTSRSFHRHASDT